MIDPDKVYHMTKEAEYIKLTMCSLKYQKIIEQKECFIKIHDNGMLEYMHQFLAKEPKVSEDWSGGDKEVPNFYHRFIIKSTIRAIDMDNITMDDQESKYSLNISMDGVNTDCRMYFIKRSECLHVQKILVKWAFNHDI